MHENDWGQMPYFLAVARGGSLRAAAETLGATHGTVNRQLQALEASYGVQLFRRTRAGVELTEAGQALIPAAEEAEALFLGARRHLQGLDREPSGTVRFSVTGTMVYEIVSPILIDFFKAYPEIDVEVRVRDGFDDINRLETDVSLRVAYDVQDEVVARKLYTMPMAPFASQEYLDQVWPNVGPGGEGLSYIGWDKVERHPDWMADTQHPKAHVRHATMDHVLQIALARRGFGVISTTPYMAKIYPELVQVPGTEVQPGRSMFILLHSDLRRTTRVRRFVDFLAEGMARIRPLIEGTSD